MKISAYEKVYEELKKRIYEGTYPADTLLPAEPELQKMFQVSRTTVRSAVERLTKENLVQPKRGIGTVIRKFKITQPLNKLTSMSQTMKERGFVVTYKEKKIELVEADSELLEILNLQKGEKVAKVVRVMCISSGPFAYVENYIPYQLVEGIEKKEEKITSLYAFLKEEYSLSIDMAQDAISAKNANKEMAKKLEVPIGEALLHLNRKCIYDGKCFCYDVIDLLPDKYEYSTSVYAEK